MNYIMGNNQYKVNDAWPIYEPTTVEDCMKKLVRLSLPGQAIECHGVDQNYGYISSTFDIRFFKGNKLKIKQPKDVEKELIESFIEKAEPHFSPEELRFIEIPRLRWDTVYNTGSVFVGRHYKLPTRCVDWTMTSLNALFFACNRSFGEPGVVWWMDYDVFSYAIATQWSLVYGKKENIEDDFEHDFIKGVNKEIIIRFHYPGLLERPKKQDAHIILSGQYNVHLDEAIRRLGVQKCGRIIVYPKIKFDLLDKLNKWGINSTTLGIVESDVDKIAENIADEILGKNI
jgi:hypothetical protein